MCMTMCLIKTFIYIYEAFQSRQLVEVGVVSLASTRLADCAHV